MGELRRTDSILVFPLWMLAAAVASMWDARPEILASAGVFALSIRTARQGAGALGWANSLTWLRIGATASLCLLEPSGPVITLLALAIFALDGVDGALARALGTSSDFGAELDKECDAFFVLMLSLLLWRHGHAGAWVLVAGSWRYAYSLIVVLASELRAAPRSNWSRYSYSASCLCLIAALWGPTPEASGMAAVATILISVSFLRSLYYCLPRS